jgi:outer membrane protein OmpA-like peptidoglycan-associated protein
MNRTHNLILAAAVAALLGACTSTPEQRIEELETARAVVPQVEASPRAGVAATYIAEARKSLDRANRLADENGKLEDIKFEADIAAKNAQIANEKILTAQAREELEKGTAERQAVLLEARERETQAAAQRAKSLEQELAELKAKPTERGLVVTLGDVLFDTGKATLKPGAYTTIDRLAEVLRSEPQRHVVIEGHTDSVGSDEYNQSLSERRAASVQAALFERGVSSEQIRALGKGESTPVASNDDPGGRQQNRRVEMIFTEDRSRTASDVD